MDWLEILRKFLPVKEFYEDAAQPAAKEIGQALRSTVKAGRLLLAPVEYLASQHDRWERYLKRIADKVSEADMIPAHPQISGPVLDGLRYVDENGVIAEMYLNLLARALDRRRVSEAHPAFVEIIRQLSPDEALILYELKRKAYCYIHRFRVLEGDHSYPYRKIGKVEESVIENEFPTSKLNFPDNFSMYVDHLENLNVLNTETVMIKDPIHDQDYHEAKEELRFTKFGNLFCEACVPDDMPSHEIEI